MNQPTTRNAAHAEGQNAQRGSIQGCVATAPEYNTWHDSSVDLRRGAFVSDLSADCAALFWPEFALLH